MDIGSSRQLFLDDHVIERVENLQRRLHRPVRAASKPVVDTDMPWEQRVRFGVHLFGGTVFFDEEDRLFKMWYRRGTDKESHSYGYAALYATSKDGLKWEKPNLGLVEDQGSKANNILPPGLGGNIRRPNLIKDYAEPDPAKRYKMFFADTMPVSPGKPELGVRTVNEVGYSPDGIHWRMRDFVVPEKGTTPQGILFGWDPRLRRFVYFRMERETLPMDVDGRFSGRGVRAIFRSLSKDFEVWDEHRQVDIGPRGAPVDPPDFQLGQHLTYLTAISYTDDLYIGTLDTATIHTVDEVPAEHWRSYMADHMEHKTELVISRDGVHWQRVAPHWEFLSRGLWGTWDHEIATPAKPIVWNDEILIYYTGRNITCEAEVPGHPLHQLVGTIRNDQRLGYAIGLAKLRLDGFVSMDAYKAPGTLTTRPLTFRGKRLFINARAPEKDYTGKAGPQGSHGSIRVEILDSAGVVIPGYGAADCELVTGDHLRKEVRWMGKQGVETLAGRQIRLRFRLQNAALYAFQFADDEETARQSVSIPLPGGKPAK